MNLTDESTTLVTAGDLAKEISRSRYGVKKALKRLGILPRTVLAGISFYHREDAIGALKSEMRAPNSIR
jgi:hypothetical protein